MGDNASYYRGWEIRRVRGARWRGTGNAHHPGKQIYTQDRDELFKIIDFILGPKP